VRGAQISAEHCARLMAVINAQREEMQQPVLSASDIFPTG
jgi:hypothetical protein